MGSEQPDRAEQTEQQPAAERCPCGYLLKGLPENRCPECGRQITSGARRRWPYLWRGFLWGFGILAVPSIALLCYGAFTSGGPGFASMGQVIALTWGGIGLAIAVVTGLLGMLIGYVNYHTSLATGWGVWWRWTIACSVGLVIGAPVGFLLGRVMLSWTMGGFIDDYADFLIVWVPCGFVVGIAVGIAQWTVLRRFLPVTARRWTIVTTAGTLGGFIAGTFVLWFALLPMPLSGYVIIGATIGLVQRFALPRFFPRGWWVAGNMAAWGCSGLIVTAGTAFSIVGERSDQLAIGMAITLAVAAMANGAISGAPWLIFRRNASSVA